MYFGPQYGIQPNDTLGNGFPLSPTYQNNLKLARKEQQLQNFLYTPP